MLDVRYEERIDVGGVLVLVDKRYVEGVLPLGKSLDVDSDGVGVVSHRLARVGVEIGKQ